MSLAPSITCLANRLTGHVRWHSHETDQQADDTAHDDASQPEMDRPGHASDHLPSNKVRTADDERHDEGKYTQRAQSLTGRLKPFS